MNAAEYRRLLNVATYQFVSLVRAILTSEGVPVTDKQRAAVAIRVLRQVQMARASTFGAARAYLRAVDPLVISPAQLAEYGLGAPLELIKRIVDDQAVAEATRHEPAVVERAAKAVARGLQRHAEQPARELVQAAAETIEGAAWQRVLTGARSCAFCAMLASRGPVYESKQTATRGGSKLDTYHDGCDCIAIYVPAGSRNWEGRAEWKRLAHMWRQADDSEDDERATRKIFRSYWEKEVRKGNGGKYVAESIIPTAEAA